MGNKVCILTSAGRLLDPRIFNKQARSLAKAGFDVTLVAQHTGNETLDGIKILAISKLGNRLSRMLGTWRVRPTRLF